jgi:hypothetical protein
MFIKSLVFVPKELRCRQFRVIMRGDGPLALQDMDTTILLPKASLVKACVLHDSGSNILYYSGNYLTSKLLLSRFLWLCNGSSLSFCYFLVKNIYKAIIFSSPYKVSPIERWEKVLGIPIDTTMAKMIDYTHDPIFDNKTKENLYKIHTRAFPVARKFSNQGDTKCAFCGIFEDDMHCFVHCNRLLPLWA